MIPTRDATPPRRLGLGFIGRAVESFAARFFPFLVIFLVADLPNLLDFALDPTRPPGVGAWTTWQAVVLDLGYSLSSRVAVIAGAFALQVLATAVVLLSVLHTLEGRSIPFGEALRRGLARAPSLVLTALVVAALTLYGCLMWVIPGLIALTFMSLAIPVAAAEKASPLRALGRSGDLASSGFFPLLLVVLVTFLAPRIVEVVINLELADRPVLAFALGVPLRVVFGAFFATLLAVAYRELRELRDGKSGADLIAAFE